jgi:ATP-dependent Lon protease
LMKERSDSLLCLSNGFTGFYDLLRGKITELERKVVEALGDFLRDKEAFAEPYREATADLKDKDPEALAELRRKVVDNIRSKDPNTFTFTDALVFFATEPKLSVGSSILSIQEYRDKVVDILNGRENDFVASGFSEEYEKFKKIEADGRARWQGQLKEALQEIVTELKNTADTRSAQTAELSARMESVDFDQIAETKEEAKKEFDDLSSEIARAREEAERIQEVTHEVIERLGLFIADDADLTEGDLYKIVEIISLGIPQTGNTLSDEEYVDMFRGVILDAYDSSKAGIAAEGQGAQAEAPEQLAAADAAEPSHTDYRKLAQELKGEVVGQDEVIDDCVDAIKVDSSPLKQRTSPTSFLFAGPTGTGKTFLAERLAERLGLPILRIDMSEFNSEASINRLIGSPPGYVGSTQDAQLVSWVKENPQSLLLFDEIDKADQRALDILLQILDKGEFSSGRGDRYHLPDSIVICTTNASQAEINQAKSPVGFVQDSGGVGDAALKGIRKFFRPEFLNRLRKVCVFNNLTSQDIERLVGIKLGTKFTEWRESFNLIITLEESATKAICELAFDDKSGARELNRVIDKVIINQVIDLLAPDFEDKTVVVSSTYREGQRMGKSKLLESFEYAVTPAE